MENEPSAQSILTNFKQQKQGIFEQLYHFQNDLINDTHSQLFNNVNNLE